MLKFIIIIIIFMVSCQPAWAEHLGLTQVKQNETELIVAWQELSVSI